MREHAAIPREYELMIVVAPTVGDDGLQDAIERVSGYVTAHGGDVTGVSAENPWGRRRLAYPIQDHRDAFYVLYFFTAPPDAVLEMEREIKLDEQVIRHLVVRYDELAEHEDRQRGAEATLPFRRSRPSEAAAEDEAAAPAPASAEQVEPVQPEALAVEATRKGDTEASIEEGDPGEQTEEDEA